MWLGRYSLEKIWDLRTEYANASADEQNVAQFATLLAVAEVLKQQRSELETIRKLLWGIWIILAAHCAYRILAALIPSNWYGP